jgi:UDP-N-acetylglucosamine 2-epimerase (non-hydrolysing)
MIDSLLYELPLIKESKERFFFCTLHRGENVDDKKVFTGILSALKEISEENVIYFPLHPRTEKKARKFGLMNQMRKIFKLLPPLSYGDTIWYEKNAELVLTDSGGIQEETSILGTPCLTLRTETERPVTVKYGTNTVAGITKRSILAAYHKKKPFKRLPAHIPLWDGSTARRIVDILKRV